MRCEASPASQIVPRPCSSSRSPTAGDREQQAEVPGPAPEASGGGGRRAARGGAGGQVGRRRGRRGRARARSLTDAVAGTPHCSTCDSHTPLASLPCKLSAILRVGRSNRVGHDDKTASRARRGSKPGPDSVAEADPQFFCLQKGRERALQAFSSAGKPRVSAPALVAPDRTLHAHTYAKRGLGSVGSLRYGQEVKGSGLGRRCRRISSPPQLRPRPYKPAPRPMPAASEACLPPATQP